MKFSKGNGQYAGKNDTCLLQTAVLAKRPVGHDSCRHDKEDVTCHSLRSNVETDPLVDLSGVIGARHDVEQEATGDLVTAAAAWASEVPQQDVAVEVCDLADDPETEPNLHLQISHWGVQRVVAVVSNVSAEGPVVGAVSEDI